jgi:peptide/nickel transport system substrate-binding protein
MIKEWKRGDSYEYERNPNYFKKGRPFFDGRKVFPIQDYSRLLATLKTQQVMATAYMPSSFQPVDMLLVQEETKGRMRAMQAPNTSLYGFWFHWNKPPLDNPQVRRAIYLAVDRQEILKIALSGYGQVAGFFPPGYVETDEALRQLPGYRQPKEQDLAEAKKLLADAGYGSGMKLTFNIDQSKISRNHAEVLAAQLKKLGIELTLQPADRATFYTRLRDATTNLSTIGSGFYFNEPEAILDQWYALDTQRNPHDWKDPRLTELMDLQGKEVNPAARRAMFQEMAKILQNGEGHYVPVFWANAGGSFDYRLQNFQPPYHPHTIWKWEHVWFDPDAPLPK